VHLSVYNSLYDGHVFHRLNRA